MKYIYVVEDEDNIRDLVVYALNNSGFSATGLINYTELEEKISVKKPNLILLDIMLEGEDGYTILSKLKTDENMKDVPVIMLTAKNEEMDKVRGLDMGADDYITKPFGVMELVSRIKAVLRRFNKEVESEEKSLIILKNIKMDLEKRTVMVDDK